MTKKWEYQGDIDVLGYGGMFARHVGDRRYHVLRFDNMEEHLSEAEMVGHDKYVGTLVEVDLDVADVEAARRCCGSEGIDFDGKEIGLAFEVAAYGEYAPLVDESGNNGNKIIRNLKRESREIEGDDDRYESLMSRPVNEIGSTAREYQAGDIYSALHRGENEQAKLVTKMYHAADGNTLGAGNVSHLLPPKGE